MKRIVPLFLALLMLAVPLASCSETDENPSDTQSGERISDTLESETTPEDTAPVRLSDNLPETNLDGWTLRIISHGDGASNASSFYAEEYNGKVMNDAIYERDLNVKSRFNFEIALNQGSAWREDITMLTQSVKAGSRDYDLSFLLPYASNGSVISDGVLYNMLKVDYINYDQPWWHTDMNEQYTIGDYLPFVSSDYLISAFQYANMLIFNKNMAADNPATPDLYELVRSGKWTFDAFEETIALFSNDVNGDGVYDEEDSYGFATNVGFHAITWGYAEGDVPVYINKEEGTFELGFSNERFYDTAAWLYGILYNNNATLTVEWGKGYPIDWDTDRLFMEALWPVQLERFRDSESDYGILPYPKFDEYQDKYYTYVDARAGALAIPIDVEKETLSKVGLILEAQSCASHYDTVPVYVESIQNGRYSRDPESIEMMDYVAAGRRWDIGYSFSGSDRTYVWVLYRNLAGSGGQIASSVKSLEAPMIARFDEILKAYQELADLDWEIE